MLDIIYKRVLINQISRYRVPGCVAVVFPNGVVERSWPSLVAQMVEWCRSLGIESLIVCTNKTEPEPLQNLVEKLKDAHADVTVQTAQGEVFSLGRGGPVELMVSLGYGGKKEVTEAVVSVLKEVESGRLDPEDIDENAIESKLQIKRQPDLVIRADGTRLSNFMIWQSAYSELYFAGEGLNETGFLRAIRDFQRRDRRFGR